jgi:xanthine dehydrogenase YagT iron-sulfur-binding subunit
VAVKDDLFPAMSRRAVLKAGAALGVLAKVPAAVSATPATQPGQPASILLDALREHLALPGTKKGCDHGQCGACTVLVNGRRINSCLALAVMHQDDEITTIEGLGSPPSLHPMQAAFLRYDGFQCGYCTPGQICSAVGMLREIADGWPSHVTQDLRAAKLPLTDDEIRERMSGNVCRCAAYANIVAAIREVAGMSRT